MKRLIPILLLAATLGLSCGNGGGTPSAPAPAPAPVLRPLSWQDVPSTALSVDVGQTVSVTLLLSAAVDATYSADASNSNIRVTTETLRSGVVRVRITGISPGTSQVRITASATGYTSATASFQASVRLVAGITGEWEGTEDTAFYPYDWWLFLTDSNGVITGEILVQTQPGLGFNDYSVITSGSRDSRDDVQFWFAGDFNGSFFGTWYEATSFSREHIYGFIDYEAGTYAISFYPSDFGAADTASEGTPRDDTTTSLKAARQ